MHPLVPFLLGQPHPQGKRLVNLQKCLRTDDIDKIGNSFHLTFFEMLGNWSLGDYWKEDAIKWSLEFLTSKDWLGLDKNKIFVSVFEGDEDIPKDEESAKIWQSLGIPKERIFYLPKNENWWGPAGNTGPCGPDTEMFYDTGKEPCGNDCRPGCFCGKYFEIWNDVFMEYNKTAEGKYELLDQKNVDTGMGVERTVAVLQGKNSVYEIEEYKPIVDIIKKIARLTDEKQEISVRIIADHSRAATFILAEKIIPKKVEQGYILRRLIRRAIRHGKILGIEKEFLTELAKIVIDIHKKDYPHLDENKIFILDELKKEELKFRKTLVKGLKKFEQAEKIDGSIAFTLYATYGFPPEMTIELAKERGMRIDIEEFKKEFKKHQKISKVGAEKKFGSGLADTSEQTVKLHTATHLLNEALRRVLKKRDIIQKGSNITPERLRFDFNFNRKLTDKEMKEVEDLVNKQIKKALPVKRKETTVEEAKKMGAQTVFEQKYGKKVFVYSIGDFSLEICSGPHVKNTKELGKFKIIKEEGIASGVRRIRAILES